MVLSPENLGPDPPTGSKQSELIQLALQKRSEGPLLNIFKSL